jgi:hypothetical protein
VLNDYFTCSLHAPLLGCRKDGDEPLGFTHGEELFELLNYYEGFRSTALV